MTRIVRIVRAVFLISVSGFLHHHTFAQDAESYYISDVDPIVQSKCIDCHVSGGQASSTSLRFTSSASGNHGVFDSYVMSPARAERVLTKITGGAGHGGGAQVAAGSSDYQKFEQYMEYLTASEGDSTAPEPPSDVSAQAGDQSATVTFAPPGDDGGAEITQYTATSSPEGISATCSASPCLVEGLTNGTAYVFTVTATNEAGESAPSQSSNSVTPEAPLTRRIFIGEPISRETHSGVGQVRGWAVASDGILKVEIYVDGVYAQDAPYGGLRGDVAAAFPDVPGSDESGFALTFNYSELGQGTHTVQAIAYTTEGATRQTTVTFEVVSFPNAFITSNEAVSLDNASCAVNGDEISVVDALVEQSPHDLLLKWRRAEQGFEIVEIR